MTTAKECESIARSLFDSTTMKNAHEVMTKFIAPDAELVVMATGERHRGVGAFVKDVQRWTAAFPDMKLDVTNVVAAEDRAVLEISGSGTNTGPLALPDGVLPPTGKKVDVDFCAVLYIKNGKVTVERDYFDLLSFMQQLEVSATAPAGAEQQPHV